MFSNFRFQPSTVGGLGNLLGVFGYVVAGSAGLDERLSLIIGMVLLGLTKIFVSDAAGKIGQVQDLARSVLTIAGASPTIKVVAAPGGASGGAAESVAESAAPTDGARAPKDGPRLVAVALLMALVGAVFGLAACTPAAQQRVNVALDAIVVDALCIKAAVPAVGQAAGEAQAGDAAQASLTALTGLSAAALSAVCQEAATRTRDALAGPAVAK